MLKKFSKNIITLVMALAMMSGCFMVQSFDSQAAGFDPTYLASHPYAVFVNRAANCVTVYQYDSNGAYTVPVKSFICTCGRNNSTPLGTYTTSDYYVWHALTQGTYGRYCIRFNGSILFHSTPYSAPRNNALITEAYNNLGKSTSAGCVRLALQDEIWLYNNIPAGSYVVVYDDASNPGPLGRPTAAHINTSSPLATYDPSEVNYQNTGLSVGLYAKKQSADGTVHVYRYCKTEDLGQLIGMRDSSGTDLGTWQYTLKVTGNFDSSTPGTYSVSITGTDYRGNSDTQSYTLVVE